jgi:hypothetical protein
MSSRGNGTLPQLRVLVMGEQVTVMQRCNDNNGLNFGRPTACTALT